MKKRLAKVVFAAGLFLLLFGFTACTKKPSVSEHKVRFSAYTQEERKAYINRFLQENYGFRGEVSEVKQKQLTPFKSEEHYFATVKATDKDLISVWVSEEGEITDTVFLEDMQPRLAEFFQRLLEKKIPKFKMYTHTDVMEIPSKKLTAQDDIREYLSHEETSTCIRVFVDDPSVASETLLDELEQELNFCNTVIYLYVCEDLEKQELTNDDFDYNAVTYSRIVFKE